MKQLLFDIKFITFLCLLVCFLRLICIFVLCVLYRLFWRVNQMTENRRRFASKVGHLWYFMGLSCKVRFPWRLPVRPKRRTSKQPAEWEKVGVAATVAPSSFLTRLFLELTRLFWNFFLFFRFFSIVFSTEKVSIEAILHLSISFGKLLTFS
jgi:hypothetical protein